LDEDALKSLVATLEDDSKRAAFVETLKSALAAQEAQKKAEAQDNIGAQLVASVSHSLGRAGDQLSTLVNQMATIPHSLSKLQAQVDEPDEQQALLIGVLKALAVLLAGTVARLLTRALLRPLRARLTTAIRIASSWER
jgi:hypothetical protein